MNDPVGAPVPAPEPVEAPTTAPTLVLEPAHAAAFMRGEVGLPAGARVHASIGGRLYSVPTEELQTVLSRPGARPATEQEVHEHELQRQFGDSVGMLQAGGAGLARGASAGLSDPLIIGAAQAIGGKASAEHARKTLAGLQEANPVTSGVSEFAGAVAPLAVGDAAGLAAESVRGAGAVSRGIAGLGEVAGQGAAHLVGDDATSFLGRLAQSAVREGANAGAQTALYNVGQEISESSLGDTDLNGEKLWMAAGHGFLLGAAGGGLLAETGALGREVLGRTAPKVAELADEATVRAFNLNKKMTNAVEDRFGAEGTRRLADRAREEGLVALGDNIENIAAKTAGRVEDASEELKRVVGQVGVEGVPLADVLDTLDRQVASYAKEANGAAAEAKIRALRDRIEGIYAEKVARAERAAGKAYKLDLAPGETRAAAVEEPLEITSKRQPFVIDPDAGIEDTGEHGWRAGRGGMVMGRAEEASPIVIDRTRPGHIGEGVLIDPDLREGADIGPRRLGTETKHTAGISKEAFTKEAGAVRKPLHFAVDAKETARLVAKARQEFTVPFEELLQHRRGLEKDLDWLVDKAGSRAMKSAGRGIEELLVNAGDRIAGEKAAGVGSQWKDEYLAAKKRISELLFLNDAAENALAQRGANRGGSLGLSATDSLAAAAGAAGGIAAHGAIGGLHGVALGAAHHVIRERANATAAVLLDKLAAMGGVQRAVQRIDTQIARGVENAVSPGSRAKASMREVPFGREGGSHAYRVEAVSRAAAQPDEHADTIADAVAPIATHAPAIASAFQRAAMRATAMMAGWLPAGHRPSPSITPQFDKTRSTETERAEFDRASHLAHDPIGYTFDRIDSGTLTSTDVATVKTIAPRTYEQITEQTREQLAALKKPLPRARQLQLETLLGVPDQGSQVSALLGQAGPSSQQLPPHGRPGSTGAPKRQLKVAGAIGLQGSKVMT